MVVVHERAAIDVYIDPGVTVTCCRILSNRRRYRPAPLQRCWKRVQMYRVRVRTEVGKRLLSGHMRVVSDEFFSHELTILAVG